MYVDPSPDQIERAERFLRTTARRLAWFRDYPLSGGGSFGAALEAAGAPPHGTPVRRLMTGYLLRADARNSSADLATVIYEAAELARRDFEAAA